MDHQNRRASNMRKFSRRVSLAEEQEATLGSRFSTTLRPDFENLFNREKIPTPASSIIEQDEDRPEVQFLGGRDPERWKRWSSLGIVFVINFLLMVQNSLYRASMWPFLSQIDPTATQTFFGFVIMAFNLASAIASPLFGYWTNRIQQVRIPIITGILATIVGNLLLGFVEAFPTNRKWIVFIARFITGFGVGNVGSLYAYVVMATNMNERNNAIALRAAANSLGLLLGPALQVAFVSLSYPGFVSGKFHFNMYTAPAFLNIGLALISIAVMVLFFREYWISVDESELNDDTGGQPAIIKPKLKPFDKLAVLVSSYVRFVILFCFTYDTTIGSPFTMAMFKWTRSEAVTYNGIISMASGCINFSLSLFVGTVIMKFVEERILILLGLSSFFLFFVLSFSWPGLPMMISAVSSNASSIYSTTVELAISSSSTSTMNSSLVDPSTAMVAEVYSCDYTWCAYTTRINLAMYLVGYVCMIMAFGVAFTPNGTLFSKILGPRKQGTMQGFFAGCGQLAMTVSPILCSSLFEYQGPRVTWVVGAAILASAILLVAITYRRLVPWTADSKTVPIIHDYDDDYEKEPLLKK